MQFNEIKFSCSMLGRIMTDPRSKADKEAGVLSETAKAACVERYIYYKYGRRKDIQSKYIEKGVMSEEDSLTLYSRVNKKFYKKNEQLLENSFLRGIPDSYIGETVNNCDELLELKSSWDLFSFFNSKIKQLDNNHYWQVQGYYGLTSAKSAKLAYCLVSSPELLINDEKRRFMWKTGLIDENEISDEAFPLIEKNMKFDDIPIKERLHEVFIERDDEAIRKLYKRILQCRKWLNETYG